MSVVDLRVKLADYDVESHTEKPLENDGETSPEKTRDDEAQRSRKSAAGTRTPNYTRKSCGYNRIRLDMSTLLGHDMSRAC